MADPERLFDWDYNPSPPIFDPMPEPSWIRAARVREQARRSQLTLFMPYELQEANESVVKPHDEEPKGGVIFSWPYSPDDSYLFNQKYWNEGEAPLTRGQIELFDAGTDFEARGIERYFARNEYGDWIGVEGIGTFGPK